ncbi:antA/AntB antirepressor family protein [Paraburkholderia panacisoli]|uniref:antA/AntB antirepressor family protein n=1 Tax=Paraburkholderia panacisoli TaxID=2603818 RepID=UPI00165FA08A|nr:antA/AntB antirepressor family protein [Paraburkholderia panacisoli]
MSNLISISSSNIGGQTVQSADARELYAFLGISRDFNQWMRDQIKRARLVEGRDYLSYEQVENLSGGRPRKEYTLTIDASKHIAMMSGSDKGFEVRDYFLECERRAKSAHTEKSPATLSEIRDAAQLFPSFFGVATLIGCDKQAAAISANQAVQAVSGTNVLQLMGQTHITAANQESKYYTPTELGKQIGTSARGMNLLLAESGFQMKRGEHWEVTDAGKDFARIYDTGKKHGSGVPIQQIKWSAEVIPALGKDAA